jgi:glutamate N-acetyltransferase/amino-acid N-acetyltransferase
VITAPRGFRAAGVACGIKNEGHDLALVVADAPVTAAAVFTTNYVQAAPILISRGHLAGGSIRAVVVNSGCANAATGPGGLEDARAMAQLTADALGCTPRQVLVASTGVIGVTLPMDRVASGINAAAKALSADAAGASSAALAIMTTDRVPKQTVVEFDLDGARVRIGAMAKGAGMISPKMATLLAFFTTDVAIEAGPLRDALVSAVGTTFNRITVDSDTSTNDMAAVLASGASSAAPITGAGPGLAAFTEALRTAAWELSEALLRDAEGATRLAQVRIEGARTTTEADQIARAVADSPLLKTALHGGDPNWGRELAAVGRSGVAVDPGEIDIWIGDVHVAADGAAREYDEALAHEAMVADPALIRVRLRSGSATGSMWTCDLTREYVDINAHYRS